MDPVAAVFGKRVRALRKSRGLTQEELARLASMDPKHVGAVERGAKTSSFYAVHRLADALKVNYYELFLPENRKSEKLEQEITSLIRDQQRIDIGNVQDFLKALRAALRKLERGDGP
jgi:transcriptional regulator with XRE-family HTH domain